MKLGMAQKNPQVSIILPTYNESQNIVGILKSIHENLPKGIYAETIVVDDNSPDGTGKIVEDYISSIKKIVKETKQRKSSFNCMYFYCVLIKYKKNQPKI